VVKTAIVMGRLHVNREQAEARFQASGGVVSAALLGRAEREDRHDDAETPGKA